MCYSRFFPKFLVIPITFLVFIFVQTISFAQNNELAADSLYRILTVTQEPKQRLEILSRLVREIHYSDSAQPYYLEAIELARNLNEPSLLAQNLTRLGVYYRNNNLQDEALYYYEEALAVSERANNRIQIGHALNSIGQIFYYQELYDEALNYYNRAGEYFQLENDLEGLSYNLTGKSLVLGGLGKYPQAIEAIDAAISIRSDIGNERQLIVSKFNKAQLLLDMGDLEAAEQDILSLLKYGKDNDYFRAMQALEQLATIQLARKQYVELEKTIETALEYHQIKPNREAMVSILSNGVALAKLQKNTIKGAYLDSLLAEEKKQLNTQKTREYLAKLTIQRQKREIEQLNRENDLIVKAEKFKSYIFILFIAISFILFFLVVFYKRYLNQQRELNQQLKVQKIKTEVQANELFKTNKIKDKILGILSHDLRGPLHSLQGMLELVSLKSLDQEEFERYIPQLSRDLENNVLLLENLLLWSKNQMQGMQTNKSSFDLTALVNDNFELIRSQSIFKKQVLINKLEPNTLIFADRNMIEIVIRNLLNNAIKFTSEGDEINVDAKKDNGEIIICVEDKGVGMSEEVQNKLFKNDFYSTIGTNKEGGTGLGLMISKELVEHNKGRIWVESQPKKGSKFIFTIPLN